MSVLQPHTADMIVEQAPTNMILFFWVNIMKTVSLSEVQKKSLGRDRVEQVKRSQGSGELLQGFPTFMSLGAIKHLKDNKKEIKDTNSTFSL